MTYKTRQEVLRAAADWMDVCEKAGITAHCKFGGAIINLKMHGFHDPSKYEFPLDLLDGKEVWVGSELYSSFFGKTFVVTSRDIDPSGDVILCKEPFGRTYIGSCSWSQPKPKTVMVEMLVGDANHWAKIAEADEREFRFTQACKKALEKL